MNEAFTMRPIKGKLKPLMDNCKYPANCEMLCVPMVNSTLWNDIPKKAHHIDLGLQEAQKAMIKAAQVLVLITDDVLKAKTNKKPLTLSSYVGRLTNCLNFLGHTGYLTSLRRRDLL